MMLASATAPAYSATTSTYLDKIAPLPSAVPRRRRTWHPSRRSHLSSHDSDSDHADDDGESTMMVDSPVPRPAEHFDHFDADFSYDSNTRPTPDTPSAELGGGALAGNAPLSALRRTMHDSLMLSSPCRSPSVRKGHLYGGGGGAAGSRRTMSSLGTMRPLVFKKQQSLPTTLPSSTKLLNLILYQDNLDKENTYPCAPPPSPTRHHPCSHLATRPPLATISSYYPSVGVSRAQLAALFSSCLPSPPHSNPPVRRSAKSTTQLRNEYMHAVPATTASRSILNRSDTFPVTAAASDSLRDAGSRRSLPAYIPSSQSQSRAVVDVRDADHYYAPVPLTAAEDPMQRADFEVDMTDLGLLPAKTRAMMLTEVGGTDEEMIEDEKEMQQRQQELR